MIGSPADEMRDDTVGGMENPRFAAHLPSGKFLDWAWERHPGRRGQFNGVPGLEVIRRVWDQLTDDEVARIAARSEDPQLLDWFAASGLRRTGLRSALLRNPALTYETLLDIVAKGTNGAERDGIANTRSARDLYRLLLDGYDMSTNPRQVIAWIVAGADDGDDKDLQRVVAGLDAAHHAGLVSEMLRGSPDEHVFPLETVLGVVEDGAGEELQENSWRSLGSHLAARGTLRHIRRALTASNSPGLRAALLEARRVTMTQAFARMNTDQRSAILRQLGNERTISADEAPLVLALANAIGTTNKATRSLLHGLRYEPESVTWLLENSPPEIAGTIVWHSESDPVLLSALRHNHHSHALAAGHIWRLGRIWDRLSTRVKTNIVGTFDSLTLTNLAPGPVRDWIVTSGPVGAVNGLTLKKTEQRSLLDRVEKERDPELAWVAARIAERPRDRIRMAEIGLGANQWEQGIKLWLRGASSGEITKLWSLAEPARRHALGPVLVANLRASAETSWLDRLIGEIHLEWQDAPGTVQEAAAQWLASRCGNDPDVWGAIWTLYPEWTGTLTELVDTASRL